MAENNKDEGFNSEDKKKQDQQNQGQGQNQGGERKDNQQGNKQ